MKTRIGANIVFVLKKQHSVPQNYCFGQMVYEEERVGADHGNEQTDGIIFG